MARGAIQSMPADTIDAAAAACALGWTITRLRVWRHRHPGILEPIARGQHGTAIYHLDDIRHAQQHTNGQCPRRRV